MAMNDFVLYWRDGKHEAVSGNDIADAMNRRGYGGGAVGAMDFYTNGPDVQYTWDGGKREWVRIAEVFNATA